MKRLDSTQTIRQAGLVEDGYNGTLQSPRFFALLMGLFAGVALLTAAVGLYGSLSYSVSQGTQEIGIRLTLGAARADVRQLVLGEVLRPVILGIGVGLAESFWLTRAIAAQLDGVTPHDPATLASAALLVVAVAWLAVCLPASRATRVDPIVALRD